MRILIVKHTGMALICLLLVATTSWAGSWQYLTSQRVHSMVKEGSGLWIVDVRNPPAFEQGHIEGAVNIPVEQLNVKNLSKSKPIVLADDSLGLRHAQTGADVLLKRGYEKVFVMAGGITAWEAERLPTTGIRDDIFRPVMLDDLVWAESASVNYKLYDLRDSNEITKGPVKGTVQLKGKSIEDRLKALTAELVQPGNKSGLAGRLEKPVTIILVLPNTLKSFDAVRLAIKGIQGDIRYLEGAYPLWVAREKQNPLSGPEVCPTCPSGRKASK